ncbi:MTH1187 family thiamine-binding protein [Desulfatitalea alkaliphila]|uniref:MTH1187 family thiamine-binding protein n=1 Tax=Desulfatitalea alkaliphila TaxID=2929485 RepID=A0AA41R0Y1_9BACT|nr:MTH1187 family thiamine-binding protein [Desulfatitalea alkaliphila]MCJ8499536.1 MTH1187 family thiamine-binding protein [Desulfatitalea alkaliphila]
MSVIVELSIFPMDKGISVAAYVARAVQIIEEGGLAFALNPMGTCIEGEWEEVMEVVHRCFKALQKDSDRIYLTLKADYRKGPSGRLQRKVAAVQEKLSTGKGAGRAQSLA